MQRAQPRLRYPIPLFGRHTAHAPRTRARHSTCITEILLINYHHTVLFPPTEALKVQPRVPGDQTSAHAFIIMGLRLGLQEWLVMEEMFVMQDIMMECRPV
jgi:hypothetical protein